jgi:dipeptidase D
MSQQLRELEPTIVWQYFDQICQTPRPSGYTKKVSALLHGFAKHLNVQIIQDNTGNIVIKKPASDPKRGDEPAIILQSHMDMVAEANEGTDFDFKTQSIQTVIQDGWVSAKGTTLGADNGMGMALSMAVLASNNIAHPPIEVLFTVDEETTQIGVKNLASNILTGQTLLNLDSENANQLCIGSAGSVRTKIIFPYTHESSSQHHYFKLSITGLKGGHSGCDIAAGLGNAVEILIRLLWLFQQEYHIRITDIQIGSPVYNAIPREGYASISVGKNQTDALIKKLESIKKDIRSEYQGVEDNIDIQLTPIRRAECVIESQAQKTIINALFACTNGVLRMSPGTSDTPETSTNLSYISAKTGHIKIFTMQRSLIESAKINAAHKIKAVFELAGAQVTQDISFPCWKANLNSPILKRISKLYTELFGNSPHVIAIHAGLECGFIKEKYPNLDIISLGTTIVNPHSPNEKVSIVSVAKIWTLLKAVLQSR